MTYWRHPQDYRKIEGTVVICFQNCSFGLLETPLSYQDIKNITGKPHKFNALKNRVCYYLQEVLDVALYEGCSPDIKPTNAKGHAAIQRWHYYSFDLNKEKSHITISQKFAGECKLHSIQDADHFKVDLIKEKPQ